MDYVNSQDSLGQCEPCTQEIKHLLTRRVSLLVNILGEDFIPLDIPKQKIPVVETDNTQPFVS